MLIILLQKTHTTDSPPANHKHSTTPLPPSLSHTDFPFTSPSRLLTLLLLLPSFRLLDLARMWREKNKKKGTFRQRGPT